MRVEGQSTGSQADPHEKTTNREANSVAWGTRFAIIRANGRAGSPLHAARLPVALYVRNDNHAAKLVKLIATSGPTDIHDPAPAITVMM